MGRWIVFILAAAGLAGCTSVPGPQAPVLAGEGDAWTYTATVGKGSDWSVWLTESSAAGWVVEQTRGHVHTMFWGDPDGVRGMRGQDQSDPTYEDIMLLDRGCWITWQAHFTPVRDMECRSLHYGEKEGRRIIGTGAPLVEVTILQPEHVETPIGTFTAERVRLDHYGRPDGAWGGGSTRIVWLAAEICAPVRIDDVEDGAVVRSWELAGARCGTAQHGARQGESPVSMQTAVIDLRRECSWDILNTPIVDVNKTRPFCPMSAFGHANLQPHALVEVGVTWDVGAGAPVEHTLHIGDLHEASAMQPAILIEVPFADLTEVEELYVETVAPDYEGAYRFHVRYGLDDFPLQPGSPVTIR